MKKVLTIAGSDSCGGAGIQADLKTFSAHGVYGMSVITAVTAQNTQGVFGVQDISEEIIMNQIEVIFDDIEVDAVKIGMVSKTETIKVIHDTLRKYPYKNLVVDPVMVSKSGYHLLQPDAKKALIHYLIPMATLVTPNILEAEVITGKRITGYKDMEKAAVEIHQMGAQYALIKGGHLEGDAMDILFDGKNVTSFNSPRISTENTHGTGCTLSSAIASNLAKGHSIKEAIELAKNYITMAIEHSFSIGKGVGPTHHFYQLYKNAGLL
ncbi:bifunctional hydroxymethylpyrimidine kinase/phosphomethylpyrimidine kinase [Alkaliphilus serpentinus]|uniref:Hydroxymethylpyrimidine/phosphomethylpyrimidine kinase n=1 Tax=Alkaliphilus serpentinus TaxID=1482731 RepID=A0A833HQD6_9FIRM|nr:bifunctional hydroxymethylpyrimidine kinase/phosphomethylpyrimidine kinase [Alkaliphilus serpentinus]KAB3531612.1 bifunctional hydroxymethylpyrimidine kinase/phosphomethylpyrimidine kinase [Alkaliphilus serpentinus]